MAIGTGHSFQFKLKMLPVLDHVSLQTTQEPALQLIAGDASDRKFYRLRNAPRSAICMEFPKWEGGYGGDPLSWLGMYHALRQIGIPVPEVLAIDESQCCIWTEDFGDNFLNYKMTVPLLDVNDSRCIESLDLYKQALDLLVVAQYPAAKPLESPAQGRAFDFDKLMFEMNFFLKHFVDGFLGVALVDTQGFSHTKMVEEFSALCKKLDECPRVLCHRDYHVRNVMVVEDAVKWIDFQDARMGPHSYDVVSLLRDSYVRIKPETRSMLFDYYTNQLNARRTKLGLPGVSPDSVMVESLHMGLQRNIKALGSFGYLASCKNKPSYLRYVKHTLEVLCLPDSVRRGSVDITKEYPTIMEFLESLREGSLTGTLEHRLEQAQIFAST